MKCKDCPMRYICGIATKGNCPYGKEKKDGGRDKD